MRTAALPDDGTAPGSVTESSDSEQPWYRSESWLAVTLAAFVPIVLAIVVPGWPKLALLGLGASLVVLGVVMLVRRDRTRDAGAGTSRSVRSHAD